MLTSDTRPKLRKTHENDHASQAGPKMQCALNVNKQNLHVRHMNESKQKGDHMKNQFHKSRLSECSWRNFDIFLQSSSFAII